MGHCCILAAAHERALARNSLHPSRYTSEIHDPLSHQYSRYKYKTLHVISILPLHCIRYTSIVNPTWFYKSVGWQIHHIAAWFQELASQRQEFESIHIQYATLARYLLPRTRHAELLLPPTGWADLVRRGVCCARLAGVAMTAMLVLSIPNHQSYRQ